ncbi:MAG: nitrite reductase small subunit NirD [Thermoanaerobaculia bacterium]
MDFIDVAGVNDLPVGRIRRMQIGTRTIALYHTARGFFASDNECPHRGGPLAEGDLIADEIICPWHLWGFDVATGVCTGNASIRIVTHEVKIDHDRVLVKLAPAREATSELL